MAELMDNFLFRTEEEIKNKLNTDPIYKKNIAHEVIDVLNYLLVLSHTLDIDITEHFHEKMELIKKKYPVEKCKGNRELYDYYHGESTKRQDK